MISTTCKICHKPFESDVYVAHEVRFGWGDPFDYVHCPHCGSVYISEIPNNLAHYYSSDYYSLKERSIAEDNSFLRKKLRKHLLSYRLFGKNLLGKMIAHFNKESFQWIEKGQFDFNSSILDIGCGTGRTILKLAQSGFKNIYGIDPFIESNITYRINDQEIVINKKNIEDLTDKYDVIILSHVMEHLTDPHQALASLSKIMHSKSKLILVLPLMSNFTWKHYGIKAHQFTDAPRHLFILSLKGLCDAAAEHNLTLTHKKFYYYYKIIEDVYGNMSPDIKKMNKKKLIKQLISTSEAGHACLYFQLKD